MAETQETTGTPKPDDGDAAATQTTGTLVTEGRDAPSAEDVAKLNLEWKVKAERSNALETENAALRARLEQPPAAPPAKPDEETDWREVEMYAAKGDPFAKVLIQQRDRETQRERDIIDAFQLRDLPAEKRKQVTEHYLKNRHRLGDTGAAYAEIRAKELEEENKRLTEELKKSAVKPPDPHIRTLHREVSATEHKARVKMSEAEFDRQQESLRREHRHQEVMEMQRAYTEGEIELT